MAKSPKKGLIAGACAAIGITAIVVTANVNFDTQMGKAREYISNAEYSKAVEILDEHKSKNSRQEDVYLFYADYYIAQEEYQSAMDILEEGAGKAQNTDKINAKIDEINDLYESELNKEPDNPPAESSNSVDMPTTESTTISELETNEDESSAPSIPDSMQTESSSTITPSTQSSSTTTPSTPQRKPSVVYIAASGNGSKYHRSSRCSGMNGNVIEMTREEAEAAGYSPCKKNSCYG